MGTPQLAPGGVQALPRQMQHDRQDISITVTRICTAVRLTMTYDAGQSIPAGLASAGDCEAAASSGCWAGYGTGVPAVAAASQQPYSSMCVNRHMMMSYL